jgi:predicted NBD/HSP70 family sugar kinase
MMSTVGLELRGADIVAVAIDEAAVTARDIVSGGPDLFAAARQAIERVGRTGVPIAVGVAAPSSEVAACAGAVSALANVFPGPFLQEGALPSGTAAAIAESWIGAAKDFRDAVYFAADEHVEGGIVHAGLPLLGARRRAAAVGWLALNPVEREDYRRIGCLEAEVGAAGIVRRLVWRMKAGDPSGVSDMVDGDLNAITLDHILAAARAGDGVSISVMRDTAKYLGMAAANLVSIADPEVLVLGGIMAAAADVMLEPLRIELARRLPKATMDALITTPAMLGAEAAAIGAARFASAVMQ